MSTKPPDHHVPVGAMQTPGRPAVVVPVPTQAPQPAQRVLSPGITAADLERGQQPQGRGRGAPPPPATGRGQGASQARPGGPQHVPAPAPAATSPSRGGPVPRGGGGGTQVTQTRGQPRIAGGQQAPAHNARSSPAARQGEHVTDQSSQRRGPVAQVPAQQPPPPPHPNAGQASPAEPHDPARHVRSAAAAATATPATPATAPGSFDNPPPIPATATEFESRYRDQARLLRKRAQRPGLSAEDVADYERRAAWYEGRALVLSKNTFMPRALRTPAEGVEGADYFRRALVGLLEGMADLDGIECGILAGAVHQADPTTIQRAAQLFNTWREGAEMLVQLLGVEAGEFNAEKPGERWRFRTVNLKQVDAAANIADAHRVQEGAAEAEPAAAEPAPAATPPAAAAAPVVDVAPPAVAPAVAPAADVVQVEDVTGQASAETPIVVVPPTLAPPAPPPAATPGEEKKP